MALTSTSTRKRRRFPLIRFAALTLSLACLFSLLLHKSGLVSEVFARLSPPTAHTPPKPTSARRVVLPSSAFLEAGSRSDGSFDSELMEARFRAAGLTERQALDVALHLLPLAPAIIAVDDPAFEGALIKEAKDASAYLKRSYPAQHKVLSRKSIPAHYDLEDGWIDFKVKMLLMAATHKIHDLPPPDKSAMDRAHANLLLAVQEAGLRALRVSPSDMSDAPTLNILAARIREANQGLQRATGWKGGVLGLGGRVELTVGAPGSDAEGVTVSSVNSDRLRIMGLPHSLGHEWFHALDFTLARLVMAAPSHEPLSTQLAPFRIIGNQTLASQWEKAVEQIEARAPQWYRSRQLKSIRSFSDYWLVDSEKMAFAFQAHAAKTSHTLSLQNPLSTYNKLYPFMYPTPQELDRQSPVWAELFENLESVRLTSRSVSKPSEVDAR